MLEPLPYHLAVRDHLREHAAALFQRFGSDELSATHAEELDLALLKSTYRLEPQSHPGLHELARAAARSVGLDAELELYQGSDEGALNAALYFAPGKARVVLYGPLEERLEEDELRALFGHELAHHLLWTTERGELLTTTRALSALEGAGAASSVVATARALRLATEIFADRGALLASGDVGAAVRCLVKTQTGTSEVDPDAFLAQADEVLERAGAGSDETSHPETYLRAKALSLHARGGGGAEAEIARLLEGKPELDGLDLMRRLELTEISRDLVDHLLAADWFRTPAVVGHARLLFDDYEVRTPPRTPPELAEALGAYGPTVLDYVAYLLVDFVAVDPSLEELPIALTQWLAEPLGVRARLEAAINKELKITKRTIASVNARRESLLAAAASARDEARA